MQRYNPKDIEPRWQKAWEDSQIYKAVDFSDKPKYVMLTEFPYPSGSGIHIGHAREYTYGDMLARHKRMQGYNVLYPMGYDEFGLPTENYAIKNKVTPQSATKTNVANFESQLKSLGYSFDWSRAVHTSDPNYYKWTQWLFLQFYKAGMAYQAEIAINWCPHCKTGLANEEVVNGRHERCDTIVEKKLLKQWLLKITAYADKLIDGLKGLDYPSRIADQQVNWIGRSKGAEIDFAMPRSGYTDEALTVPKPSLSIGQKQLSQNDHTFWAAGQLEDKAGSYRNLYFDLDTKKTVAISKVKSVTSMKFGDFPEQQQRDIHKHDPKFVAEEIFTQFDHVIIADMLTVFTTRPDTLYGATFIVLAPEHLLVDQITTAEQKEHVNSYRKAAAAKTDIERQSTDKEKTGVATGAHAINPINGQKIPVWIADYVLTGYGTGAIMAVPAHDERDLAFAKKYNLPVTQVVDNGAENSAKPGKLINSDAYDGIDSQAAKDKIVADLAVKGYATEKINYRLRDWVFSRQHYWGEPIPVIHCEEHGAVAVPDDQLPIELPKVEHYEPTDTGESPLSEIEDWVNTTCPTCAKPAKRETDTMPNWAGSSWYYLRYFDAHNDEAFADRKKLDYWQDVDLYLGGMEHTTLHLLYSRFWHEFFYEQGLVPTPEPYKARHGQGIIQATDGTKMSKSKGNVVNPTDVIDSGYGADALRMAIAFLAPFDQTTPWSPETVAGTHRLLQRIWSLVHEYSECDGGTEDSPELQRAINKAIKKVGSDLDTLGFNTAIAAIMECVNELYQLKKDGFAASEWQWALESLLLILAPFAPHIAEELWEQLGHERSIHLAEWPVFDESKLVQDTVTLAIQVNGKLRGEVTTAKDANQEAVVAAAIANERVAGYLADKTIRKTIYVPGKLVSFVVA